MLGGRERELILGSTVNVVLVIGTERLDGQVRKLLETNKTVTVARVSENKGVGSAPLSHYHR